ncbi:MAG: isoprenylcysteine carboxylmethyltransferase family protein [Clostridiales bacterium]|nr:isoprenylcysteine carboxylmethyltransferase family protein [Clostridiales bacterium]MDY5513568.1 isoprenylcysteine carboxylmethyltransferase family protein [Candidatus Ventricola sp.]
MSLMMQALLKAGSGIMLAGLLLFVPAGTLDYPGAWAFMALLFVPMLVFGTVLLVKSPELLKKRLNTREKERAQVIVILLSSLVFIAAFVLAGLDFRFGWTHVPMAVRVISAVLLLLAYALYMEVMRENAWLSRTVEVQQGQKVVDTGLYGIVRHPMYLATLLLFLAIPLVLGSWVSFAVMLLTVPVLVLRIISEERVLAEGLEGYEAYREKVCYRLLPGIW